MSETKTKLNTGAERRISDEAIAALPRYFWPGNVRQLRDVIERLAVGTGNKRTICSNDVSDVLHEIRRFETPSEIPLGFREEDSLDEFLARTTLGLYNHFRAVAGITPKSHAFLVSIEIRFIYGSNEPGEFYDPLKRGW